MGAKEMPLVLVKYRVEGDLTWIRNDIPYMLTPNLNIFNKNADKEYDFADDEVPREIVYFDGTTPNSIEFIPKYDNEDLTSGGLSVFTLFNLPIDVLDNYALYSLEEPIHDSNNLLKKINVVKCRQFNPQIKLECYYKVYGNIVDINNEVIATYNGCIGVINIQDDDSIKLIILRADGSRKEYSYHIEDWERCNIVLEEIE